MNTPYPSLSAPQYAALPIRSARFFHKRLSPTKSRSIRASVHHAIPARLPSAASLVMMPSTPLIHKNKRFPVAPGCPVLQIKTNHLLFSSILPSPPLPTLISSSNIQIIHNKPQHNHNPTCLPNRELLRKSLLVMHMHILSKELFAPPTFM
jgi:hypothetical protein